MELQAQKQCNQQFWAENTFIFVFFCLSKWEIRSRWTGVLRTKGDTYWASKLALPYR